LGSFARLGRCFFLEAHDRAMSPMHQPASFLINLLFSQKGIPMGLDLLIALLTLAAALIRLSGGM
jgi:hypothetical protein